MEAEGEGTARQWAEPVMTSAFKASPERVTQRAALWGKSVCKTRVRPDMVEDIFNPSTQEADAGRSL